MCDKHGGTPRFAVRSRHPVRNAGYAIDNDPALEATGRDQELRKAVEVLPAVIDG